VKQIIREGGDLYIYSIFYEIGGKWLMMHEGRKFHIYDLSSFELKTIIQSKIDSEARWLNDYG
jgi:hypothetical protein